MVAIPAHKPEFDALASAIKAELNGKKPFYFPNPGNWGDSLIREGALGFFRHYAIPHYYFPEGSCFSRNLFRNPGNMINVLRLMAGSKILIFGGGGGFHKKHQGVLIVNAFFSQFRKIIILPSTFYHPCSFNGKTTLFIRDKFISKSTCPSALFCHDMAFWIGEFQLNKTKPVGYFFRKDIEASGMHSNKKSIDISQQGNHLEPVDRFMETIGECEEIHTDRLHVAVAGALGGVKVNLYSGKFPKQKAIYHSSIKDYFPNVSFLGDL